MKVAIWGEYSGIVSTAFRQKGHKVTSCDLEPSEIYGHHIQDDYRNHDWSSYDLIIAHPPCTYIAVSGNRHYAGTELRQQAANFIWEMWNKYPDIKMCLENPVGQINKYLPEMPKPQYIQPWQFGHGETKKTGLWLRGLPELKPTNIVDGREQRIWKMPPSKDRGKLRSRFYAGIAEAMAEQWGDL